MIEENIKFFSGLSRSKPAYMYACACFFVCVYWTNCWLLLSWQLYMRLLLVFCFARSFERCALYLRFSRAGGWKNGLSPPGLCACVLTLTPSHLLVCMCTPYSSPGPLAFCVSIEETHNPPDPLHVLYAEGNPVSVFHHGDQTCPHSFFMFQASAELSVVWGTRLSQNRCSAL